MSGSSVWIRIAGCIVWALVVLVALRSEPYVYGLIGDRYEVTGLWCGAWGCSASLPRLLAWQMPIILAMVPAGWIAARSVPWVGRYSGRIAGILFVGVLGWIAYHVGQAWSENQVRSVADVARCIVFNCVAGTSVVIPVSLAGFVLFGTGLLQRLRANADARSGTKQPEDFSDVVVTHMDASS